MENLSILYKEELRNQELKANRRSLRCFLLYFIVFLVVWILTVLDIFVVDLYPVTISFILTSLSCFIPIWIYLKKYSNRIWVKYILVTLICIVSSTTAGILSFHAVLLYITPMLIAIQYKEKHILWYAFTINGFTMLMSSFFSFYHGICDLNLLIESNHLLDYYLQRYINGALVQPLNDNPNFIIGVFEFIPRLFILFSFTIMLYSMQKNTTNDLETIAELTFCKDIDANTMVYNKMKYSEMEKSYYPNIENIAVLFWDINNLKRVNDELGHAAGDLLIQSISQIISLYQNDRIRIYRIGGDEFLTIIDNPLNDEAQIIGKDALQRMKNKKVFANYELSSALGIAQGKGYNISNVVKEADKKMYENKKLIKGVQA